jgi:hypothetical protein
VGRGSFGDCREWCFALPRFCFDYLGVLDDVQIVMSAGEYDEQWWQRHANLWA